MDAQDLVVFQADMAAQRQLIERVFTMLEQRAAGLTPGNLEKLESVAYQLHNFYGAIEDLFKIIATYFENNVSDTARWHSLLLQPMFVQLWSNLEKAQRLKPMFDQDIKAFLQALNE